MLITNVTTSPALPYTFVLMLQMLCFNIVKINRIYTRKVRIRNQHLDHAPQHIRIVHRARTYAMTVVAKGNPEKWDILWDRLIFLNKREIYSQQRNSSCLCNQLEKRIFIGKPQSNMLRVTTSKLPLNDAFVFKIRDFLLLGHFWGHLFLRKTSCRRMIEQRQFYQSILCKKTFFFSYKVIAIAKQK